jgi:hypothetical protein
MLPTVDSAWTLISPEDWELYLLPNHVGYGRMDCINACRDLVVVGNTDGSRISTRALHVVIDFPLAPRLLQHGAGSPSELMYVVGRGLAFAGL